MIKSSVAAARKRTQAKSNESSELDIQRYQYNEVSAYSLDDVRTKRRADLEVVLKRRPSSELFSKVDLEEGPAINGILQRLARKKTKSSEKLNNERFKSKLHQLQTTNIPHESTLNKRTHLSKEEQVSKEASTKVEPQKITTPLVCATPSGLRTAGDRWRTLRQVQKVKTIYSEVHRRERFITLNAVLGQVRKQKKRLPKIPKVVEKTNRAQSIFVSCQMDPKLRRHHNQMEPLPSCSQAISTVASEPSLSTPKHRICFMVPSHHSPNESVINFGTAAQNRTFKTVTICDTPVRRAAINPTLSIFNDSHITRQVEAYRRNKEVRRARGGYDCLPSLTNDQNCSQFDPPVTLNEAIAAIIQGCDENQLILFVSPLEGESLLNPSYLQITAVNCTENSVLGSFLIPSDRISSLDEEGIISQYFCVSLSQDIEFFKNDLDSLLNYLTDFVLMTRGEHKAKITENKENREVPESERLPTVPSPKTDSREPNPDEIFEVAIKDSMKIYAHPNFLNRQITYTCEFFTEYNKHMFTYEFTGELILEKLKNRQELIKNFEVVLDAVDIMFPAVCIQNDVMRRLENWMKKLGLISIYDRLCQLMFTVYTKLL